MDSWFKYRGNNDYRNILKHHIIIFLFLFHCFILVRADINEIRRILTKIFYTSDPNLAILAWTGDELWWRQAQVDTLGWMDRQTDAGNDNTRRPKLAWDNSHVSLCITFFAINVKHMAKRCVSWWHISVKMVMNINMYSYMYICVIKKPHLFANCTAFTWDKNTSLQVLSSDKKHCTQLPELQHKIWMTATCMNFAKRVVCIEPLASCTMMVHF